MNLTETLLARGYNVVAVARNMRRANALSESKALVFVEGDVGVASTAERAVAAAVARFGSVELLVNNAGIFLAKPFIDYTPDDYAQLVSTNFTGFFHMTQRALSAMAPRKAGHVVSIGTSLSQQPIADVPSALPIAIKGGLEAATRSLAIEYAAYGIRANLVAPGIVDTPLHAAEARSFLEQLSPAHRLGTAQEVSDAVLFLDGASFVSGEILHLDGGAHAGKWA